MRPVDGAPASVFLARWLESTPPDETLLAEVAEVRAVVTLGHQARQSVALKVRQPLRRLIVEGAPKAESHLREVADELRVKEVVFGRVDATQLTVKPNLPVLGPKLGKELGAVRTALAAGEFVDLGDGSFRVDGRVLAGDEVLVERTGKDGWAVAALDGIIVALDTELDDELLLEGRVNELVHTANSMRRDAGLELTDRIVLTIPTADAEVLPHEDWIKAETLAVEVRLGDELAVAKV